MPRNGRVACHVDACCCVDNTLVRMPVMQVDRPTSLNFIGVVVLIVKIHRSFAFPTLNVTSQLHTGDCQPCPRVSKQRCICGRQTAERFCASPQWQCDQVG